MNDLLRELSNSYPGISRLFTTYRWQEEVLAMLLVSSAFLLLFAGAEFWRKLSNPPAEWTRKAVHFSAGSICLSFSYIFQSHYSILILSAAFALIMYVSKKMNWLASIHAVDRKTVGGVYFPLAVYLTFVIQQWTEQPAFYLIALLVLAISDAAAALVGTRYGQQKLKVENEFKSIEGSVIFFLLTFIIVEQGLLLLTPTDRYTAVATGLYIAILVTSFEFISLDGADNFFIPIGVILLLLRNHFLPGIDIFISTLLLLLFISFTWLVLNSSKKIGLSAILGIAMLAYGAFEMLHASWGLPPLLAAILFAHSDLFHKKRDRVFRIHHIFLLMVTAFIWMIVAAYTEIKTEILLFPYTLNFSSFLFVLWEYKKKDRESKYWKPWTKSLRHWPSMLNAALLALLFFIPLATLNPAINTLIFTALAIVATLCAGLWARLTVFQLKENTPVQTMMHLALFVVASNSLLFFLLFYYLPGVNHG